MLYTEPVMEDVRTFPVGENDDGKRLDRVIRQFLPDVPIGALSRMIRTGRIKVNNGKARHNTRVSAGDTIQIPVRLSGESRNGSTERMDRGGAGSANESASRDKRLPIPVLYRDEQVLVVNKPAGIPVIGPRSLTGDVQDQATRAGWVAASMSFRPGPVHRLDSNTSGIQVFSLSLSGARVLAAAFRSHTVRKLYLCAVQGRLADAVTIDSPLDYDRARRVAVVGHGRSARSQVFPLEYDPDQNRTIAGVWTDTGRTHQVRAHLSSIGHPLAGDGKYGGVTNPGFRKGRSAGTDNDLRGQAIRPTSQYRESIHVPVDRERTPPTYLLHAVAMCCAEYTWWAPLPDESRQRVLTTFPNPQEVTRQLAAQVQLHCTGAGANGKMTL